MEPSSSNPSDLRSRAPWNKGKLTGAKPPLRTKNVWSIRSQLHAEGRIRDLALFNTAIDSKLRGCDVVSPKVEDVALHGHAADRATVRQKKTGHPVRFELTEQTREAVDNHLKAAGRRSGEFLFGGRNAGKPMSTRQYARLVTKWIGAIGLDPSFFRDTPAATHESHVDLPSNRQSACGPIAAWTHEDRKHRALSRNRGGRRLGNR